MPVFPGCSCRIPSVDPTISLYDISDKGHEWDSAVPTEKSTEYLFGGKVTSTMNCTVCGLKALFSEKRSDKAQVSGWNIDNGINREVRDLSCQELSVIGQWICIVDDDKVTARKKELYGFVGKYKDSTIDWAQKAKELDGFSFVNSAYSLGASRVSRFNERVVFTANTVTAQRFGMQTGVLSVELK